MTTPDDPTWTEQEIDARANDLPVYVQPLPGIEEISQDPGLFAEQHAARFGMTLARAAVAGTAAAMIAAAVGLLGMGERPANHNAVTLEYNAKVARIGDGPWCDMGVTVEALHSGNIDAVCGGPRRGFAYTIAHAADFKRRGLWTNGLHGIGPGCVVFFSWSRGKSIDDIEHVGIVEHLYSDGTVATVECNIGDLCRREHRDGTYVVGYGRPPYTAQQEDDMPDYVSLGMMAPQKFTAGVAGHAVFTDEYSDKSKLHADGPYPGILSGGKNGAMFNIEVDASGAGSMRLIEVDPAKQYAISKTYPLRPLGVETFVGLCDANQHLYVEVHPSADGPCNVAVKALRWAR
ncbi:MAG: CHAP domain-containing protein [Actinoallomurus sp.]